VIAARQGVGQPLLGCYQRQALELLAPAARAGEARLTETVAAIGPRLHEVEDPEALFNINSPDDLLMASAMLDGRRAYPNVKS
jgi:molybdopterin-guanine dinucleotide biosynthesis protein A